MIEVELPDGSIAEFPAGTPPEVIQRALQQRFAPRVDPATNQPPGVPEFVPPGVEGYDPQTGEVARQPRSMLASAAHGASDVATLGFGDELSAGLATGLDMLPGGQGRDYQQNLAQIRGMQGQAQADNPGSYLAGQIGGAIGGGGLLAKSGLSLSANAIRSGRSLPAVAAASGVESAALGGIHGFGSGEGVEDRLSNAGTGMMVGGGLGLVAPVALAGVSNLTRRAVTPFRTSPERTAAARSLAKEGVDLTAGQRTGSRTLRYAESEIGGAAAEDIMERQAEQFTAATLRRAGIKANRATPDVIDDGFRVVGQKFDNLAANNTLRPDTQLVGDLQKMFNDYGQLVPESMRAPIVKNVTNDIVKALRRGPISGSSYQSLRSRLEKAARSSARDPELASTLRGIKDALDDAMERSIATNNPNQLGAWREARNQYRNLLVIEKAATGAGENAAMGLISPSALRNATVVGQGRRNYARGMGDFAELARAGEATMKPLPQSGTAPRMAARNLGTGLTSILGAGTGAAAGGPAGAVAGALAGAAVPRVAGAAMMSRPGQALLSNQLLAGPMTPQTRALLNSMLVTGSGATAGRR